MSQTIFEIDPYLAAQLAPKNDLTVDPKFKSIQMVTPIGRLPYVHVDQPHAISMPGQAPSAPKYGVTILMAPGTNERPIVADLHKAAALVADATWPSMLRPDPANPGQFINVPGSQMFFVPREAGGLHYPLRKGDDSYMRDPQRFGLWRGLWFINCGMNPKTKAGADQRPICLDEKGMACDPKLFYPGCYGRLQISVATFDVSGNKGVSYYLKAVQFARHGERMQSFDAGGYAKNAFEAAGAIPGDVGTAPANVGFGPNTAQPGMAVPGVPAGTPFGFAAPAGAGVGSQVQLVGASPAQAGTGARPPGV